MSVVLYEGEGFKIVGDGDSKDFVIEEKTDKMDFGWLIDAVNEAQENIPLYTTP